MKFSPTVYPSQSISTNNSSARSGVEDLEKALIKILYMKVLGLSKWEKRRRAKGRRWLVAMRYRARPVGHGGAFGFLEKRVRDELGYGLCSTLVAFLSFSSYLILSRFFLLIT
jgi:hypothetical protein